MEKIFQIYEKSKIENEMKEKSLLELIQKDIMDNVYRMELNYDNTKHFVHLLQKRIRQYKVVNNIDENAPQIVFNIQVIIFYTKPTLFLILDP